MCYIDSSLGIRTDTSVDLYRDFSVGHYERQKQLFFFSALLGDYFYVHLNTVTDVYVSVSLVFMCFGWSCIHFAVTQIISLNLFNYFLKASIQSALFSPQCPHKPWVFLLLRFQLSPYMSVLYQKCSVISSLKSCTGDQSQLSSSNNKLRKVGFLARISIPTIPV